MSAPAIPIPPVTDDDIAAADSMFGLLPPESPPAPGAAAA